MVGARVGVGKVIRVVHEVGIGIGVGAIVGVGE